MSLSSADLDAIRSIVKEELKPISDKLDKVLKFVPIEHADIDSKINGRLKVSRPQEEA